MAHTATAATAALAIGLATTQMIEYPKASVIALIATIFVLRGMPRPDWKSAMKRPNRG